MGPPEEQKPQQPEGKQDPNKKGSGKTEDRKLMDGNEKGEKLAGQATDSMLDMILKMKLEKVRESLHTTNEILSRMGKSLNETYSSTTIKSNLPMSMILDFAALNTAYSRLKMCYEKYSTPNYEFKNTLLADVELLLLTIRELLMATIGLSLEITLCIGCLPKEYPKDKYMAKDIFDDMPPLVSDDSIRDAFVNDVEETEEIRDGVKDEVRDDDTDSRKRGRLSPLKSFPPSPFPPGSFSSNPSSSASKPFPSFTSSPPPVNIPVNQNKERIYYQSDKIKVSGPEPKLDGYANFNSTSVPLGIYRMQFHESPLGGKIPDGKIKAGSFDFPALYPSILASRFASKNTEKVNTIAEDRRLRKAEKKAKKIEKQRKEERKSRKEEKKERRREKKDQQKEVNGKKRSEKKKKQEKRRITELNRQETERKALTTAIYVEVLLDGFVFAKIEKDPTSDSEYRRKCTIADSIVSVIPQTDAIQRIVSAVKFKNSQTVVIQVMESGGIGKMLLRFDHKWHTAHQDLLVEKLTHCLDYLK